MERVEVIDTTIPLKIVEDYNHPRLTEQMLDYCNSVLIGLQCNAGSMTKKEMHDFTGLGYGTLQVVISILRYGILPAYNCTLKTSRDGLGIYTVTSKPEEIAEYSLFRLGDSISRLKSELNITTVWVAVSKGRSDRLAKTARKHLRRLAYNIAELEDAQTEIVESLQFTQRIIAKKIAINMEAK